MVLNFICPDLYLPNAEITGVCHHAYLRKQTNKKLKIRESEVVWRSKLEGGGAQWEQGTEQGPSSRLEH